MAQKSSVSSTDALDMNVEATPSNYTKLAEELAELYKQNPDDLSVSLAYAEKLVQLGDVQEGAQVLLPIFTACQKLKPPGNIALSENRVYDG